MIHIDISNFQDKRRKSKVKRIVMCLKAKSDRENFNPELQSNLS